MTEMEHHKAGSRPRTCVGGGLCSAKHHDLHHRPASAAAAYQVSQPGVLQPRACALTARRTYAWADTTMSGRGWPVVLSVCATWCPQQPQC